MDSFKEGIEQLARGPRAEPVSAILRADDIRRAEPFRMHPIQPFAFGAAQPESDQNNPDSLDSQLQSRYRDGFADGHQAASREIQSRQNELWQALGKSVTERVQLLQSTFEAELLQQQQLIAERLLDLAVEMASKLIADRVAADSKTVLPVIAECLALLPSPAAALNIRLNPADAAALRANPPMVGEQVLTLLDDPAIAAGGCRIGNDELEIDATLPTRWRALMAAIGRAPS